jgi:hypothetical protein
VRSAVIAVLAFAGCSRSLASPSAFALPSFDEPDASCTTCAGGPGVVLDGVCVPIAMRSGGWNLEPPPPETDPQIVAAIARSSHGDCSLFSSAAVGDGAVFLKLGCVDGNRTLYSKLVRVDRDGRERSVAMPWAFAYLTFLPGPRPRIVAVLGDTGTLVLDARTLATLAGWKLMGGWFNATTYGAAVSPDGAWFAVPDPYRARIHIVRTADLTVVASRHVADIAAGDEGPGRVTWSHGALEVTTFRLPYE